MNMTKVALGYVLFSIMYLVHTHCNLDGYSRSVINGMLHKYLQYSQQMPVSPLGLKIYAINLA